MAGLLNQLMLFFEDIIKAFGYPGLALVMAIENLFPPIPSELILPFAGFMVARGEFSFVGVVVASVIGSTLGALVLYYVGRYGEIAVRLILMHYGRWLSLSEADLDRALAVFDRYGQAAVFFGRLMPLIRSLISIPAGMAHMPLGRFLVLTAVGSALWNTLLAGAGVILGENWENVLGFVERYETFVLVAVVVGTALVLFRPLARRLARRSEGAVD